MFDFLVKSHLESKDYKKLPLHYQEFLARGSSFAVSFGTHMTVDRVFDSQNDMISGVNTQASMKEFVSTQNFETLTKQMETLIGTVKENLDNFKRMLWNLEKFQKTKIKSAELTFLRSKFGSKVIGKTEYEEMLQRYKAYESMENKILN